jgi:cell fate regulator YaaT (PSP1 superfamily)
LPPSAQDKKEKKKNLPLYRSSKKDMGTELAGVTFRKLGKLHYYPAEGHTLEVGSRVVCETERGQECGEVKILRTVEGEPADMEKIYRLLHLASETDLTTMETRQKQAEDGMALCQERADSLRLAMKVVEAEASLDGQQMTFYFVADSRVDFRQLVKEVASRLRMRVHLHQVGSRDHARALGGYGPCGRPLCCTTFLRDFAPVSMKMAKDQSLYLNPSKFSGVCGKLMCCLRYEHEVYMEARDRLPTPGMTVSLPTGERGVVSDVNILKETVLVVVRTEEDTRLLNVAASEVQVARACGDCGSAGGGCGSNCASGGCGVPAKVEPQVIQLQRWQRNWTA